MSIEFNMTNAQEFGKEDKKRKKRNDKNHEEEEEESFDHEMHIWTERERRKKMREMFTKLHALLPQLPPKADKSTIVDEAVTSIKSFEQTLHKLQMKKLEKLQYYSSPISNTTLTFVPSSSSTSPTMKNPIVVFDTWSSQNVVLNICGNEAFFNVCCPKDKSGVFITLCYLLEKYNIEVVFVSVSSNIFRRNYMIQTQIILSDENQILGDGFGVGDIFKQAAQELVLYFSSS